MLFGVVVVSTRVWTGSDCHYHSTRLDEIKNLHSADSIATETYGTRGRSVWVHSSQVRLLDSSLPHNSLLKRVGPLGTGVARKLGTEPRFRIRI